MKTDFYCYMENKEKLTLPDGVPNNSNAFTRWLNPDKTAVIEIDMHRGHVGPDDKLTLAVPRAKERVERHNIFQDACRKMGIPIIHVQHWQRHGGIDDLNTKKSKLRGSIWTWSF